MELGTKRWITSLSFVLLESPQLPFCGRNGISIRSTAKWKCRWKCSVCCQRGDGFQLHSRDLLWKAAEARAINMEMSLKLVWIVLQFFLPAASSEHSCFAWFHVTYPCWKSGHVTNIRGGFSSCFNDLHWVFGFFSLRANYHRLVCSVNCHSCYQCVSKCT